MTLEIDRRARWNRTRDAAKSRGVELESAPAFLELIEEWIAGRITMQCVQEGYAALVRSRGKSSRGSALVEKNVLEEIFAEVPEVSGLMSRAPQERDDASDHDYSVRNDASPRAELERS